jgi:hypothetical protein
VYFGRSADSLNGFYPDVLRHVKNQRVAPPPARTFVTRSCIVISWSSAMLAAFDTAAATLPAWQL